MPQVTSTYGSSLENPALGLIDQEDEGRVLDGTGILWDGVNENSVLFLTDFGFAIPGTATIDGIAIGLTGRATGTAPFAAPYNGLDFQFTKDGSTGAGATFDPLNEGATGQYHKDFTGSIGAFEDMGTIGGPADLHGTTWTPAVVNDSNFGLILSVRGTELDTMEIDYIYVTIYYSDAVGGTVEGLLCAESIKYIAQGIRCLDPATKKA